MGKWSLLHWEYAINCFLLKNICNIGLCDEKISMIPYASDNIVLIVEQEGWGGEKKTMALL